MQIGQQVIYVPGPYDQTQMDLLGSRLAAVVTHVYESGLVNVVVFDSRASTHIRTSVAVGVASTPAEGFIEA